MNLNGKLSVVMVQVNYQYGQNVFVPYSVGSLQAYAETIPEIRKNFLFREPVFLRQNPVEVLRGIEKEPAVVGFSSYLWNWEYNKKLAKLVREAYPKCLIVFGGTHVPDASDGFFMEHPYVDILVHHEGEISFAEILLESLSALPDYSKIPGLSVRVEGNRTQKTAPGQRIGDLSKLPSPYLAGVFDFMLGMGFLLNVSQETNRGCPYSCTFCDWGGSSYDKFFQMDEERILSEFEWFGAHGVEYVFNCDANYGILGRDFGLTESMVKIRAKHGGYPKRFRMCTAKNSNDKIFAIVKLLNDADMNKGATLSFQSMDETTLINVKRSNIKITKFSDLMDRYRKAGIATYTELILGMPGETYESSKRGIDTLLDAQADAVNLYVYTCTMLPNSVMSRPAYVEVHGIKSVRMPVLLAHSTPDDESMTEYTDTVVGTSSMPEDDWQHTYLFYWAVQAFHCLGLVQQIAILFHRQFGMKYSDFYEWMIRHFIGKDQTLVGRQVSLTRRIIAEATKGGRLDLVVPRFGEIYWPLEEATFLSLVADKEAFYSEIRFFLGALSWRLSQRVDEDLLDDLVSYQSSIIKDPNLKEVEVDLRYDFHDYFSHLSDKEATLERFPTKLVVKAREDESFGGDLESYAKNVVWYGRKGGRFHHSQVTTERL